MSKQKKGRGREAKVNTPIGELDQKETLMHYNAVLMEEQSSMIKLILERMDGLREQVDQKTDSLRVKIDAFRSHTEKRFSVIEHAVRGLKDDMIDMERRICSKLNRVAERGDNLSGSVF